MSCCYNRALLEYVMQTNKIGLEICKVDSGHSEKTV